MGWALRCVEIGLEYGSTWMCGWVGRGTGAWGVSTVRDTTYICCFGWGWLGNYFASATNYIICGPTPDYLDSATQLSALWLILLYAMPCGCSSFFLCSLSLALRGGRDAGGSHSAQGEARIVPPNADKAGDEGLSGVDFIDRAASTHARKRNLPAVLPVEHRTSGSWRGPCCVRQAWSIVVLRRKQEGTRFSEPFVVVFLEFTHLLH